MRDAGGVVTADDVADRVGLADRGEEAVPEPLPGRGAAHEPRDVEELDRLRHRPRRAHHARDRIEPLVGHLDDGDVRLDRGERIVADLRAAACERVEEGRLARVRKADDADLQVRSPRAMRSISRASSERSPTPGTRAPMASPSAAPASTSLG